MKKSSVWQLLVKTMEHSRSDSLLIPTSSKEKHKHYERLREPFFEGIEL